MIASQIKKLKTKKYQIYFRQFMGVGNHVCIRDACLILCIIKISWVYCVMGCASLHYSTFQYLA